MARTKQTSRKDTRKRYPLATKSSPESKEEDNKSSSVKYSETATCSTVKKIKTEKDSLEIPPMLSEIKSNEWIYISSLNNGTSLMEGVTNKRYPIAASPPESEEEDNKNSIVKYDETATYSTLKNSKTERDHFEVPTTQPEIISNEWTHISFLNSSASFNEYITDKRYPLTMISSQGSDEDNKSSIVKYDETAIYSTLQNIKTERDHFEVPPTEPEIISNHRSCISSLNSDTCFNEGVTNKSYSLTMTSSEESEGDNKSSIGKYNEIAIYPTFQNIKTERDYFEVPPMQSEIISNDWSYISSLNSDTSFNEGFTTKRYFLATEAFQESEEEEDDNKSGLVKYDETAIYPTLKKIKTERDHFEVLPTQSQIISNEWTYISSLNNGISFKEGVTDKMEGLPDQAGKWMMFVDGEDCIYAGTSHYSYAWKIIKTLVLDFKNTRIISAKCTISYDWEDYDYNSSPKGVICCYTTDYEDKQSVKRAAEAIQKAYPQDLIMYYKTENDSHLGTYSQNGNKNITKYKYCSYSNGYKFYERGDDFKWQLVAEASRTIALSISKHINLPSSIFSHEWLYISSMSGCQEIEIETSKDIIDLPPRSGKWLLFISKSSICPFVGMTHHNHAWQILKSLVLDSRNSRVIGIKCSTSQTSSKYTSSQGVICCYTENFGNKLDVKKAADAIRKTYPYPCPMYYKTEETTLLKKYSKRRNSRVSIYKHTSDFELFERDCVDEGRWKLIIQN